jgi:hypothetical protein
MRDLVDYRWEVSRIKHTRQCVAVLIALIATGQQTVLHRPTDVLNNLDPALKRFDEAVCARAGDS